MAMKPWNTSTGMQATKSIKNQERRYSLARILGLVSKVSVPGISKADLKFTMISKKKRASTVKLKI
jgi:hypothetical protein